jgi:DNA-binding transcriptional LysR family regulator
MDRLASMETFVRVVETGSFSSAARHLRVGQPAVSKTVAQLEERLGVKLLIRSTRGLSTTEAGQAYLERARRSIEEADEADLAARGAGAGLTGRLRISAATTFASIHIIPALPAFLSEHAGLDLEIVLDDRNIDLVDEGVDVALRMGKLADSSLTARRLGEGRRIVVGTPAYFERAGMPRVPGDLLDHKAIVYLRTGEDAWTFSQGSVEESVTMRSRLKVSAAEGVRAAVFADMGLAVASEWMFRPELEAGTAMAVLADWELPALDLWAVFPAGRVTTAKARAFIAHFVRGFFAREADRLPPGT